MSNAAHAFAGAFAPHTATIDAILAQLDAPSGKPDGSHDWSHVLRVWNTANDIAAHETGTDLEVLAVATLLHDCVNVEKNDPRRAQASRLSAERARAMLAQSGWSEDRIDAVAHAIEAHSFSAKLEVRSVEARVLRDADRLDAIGAIGIARTFYVAGRMGSRLYEPTDPDGQRRPLDDARFALDHFALKLFKLEGDMLTARGKELARDRTQYMRHFITNLIDEIGAESRA